MNYDYIIVGAGFAGAVLAERIATKLNKKVLILERRAHIAGNCYDEINEASILIHTYGPHLFHTDNKEVYDYLSQFTQWEEYVHQVVASVDGDIIPIPFNFNTLYQVYPQDKAELLEHKLISRYGKDQKIPILELMQANDGDLQELAQYVYDKIFVNYTAKQWGKKPEEIDSEVTARVPVFTGYDNRYFTDKYQVVPNHGYTKLFEAMLRHPNITVELNSNALDRIELKNDSIFFDNEVCDCCIIYTGMIDELFGYTYGELPYRSVDLRFETIQEEYFQNHAVVNYPNEFDFTRITEFKHIHPINTPVTTILKEYPQNYIKNQNTPYYPVFTEENQNKYRQYAELSREIPNLILIGRLAEYKYYDMDDIVARALEVFEDIISS